MFFQNEIYEKEIGKIVNYDIEWGKIGGKRILITGASGLLGTVLIDAVMLRNKLYNANIKVYAMSRNEAKAQERFKDYWNLELFHFIQADINKPFYVEANIDYIIHAASNTHPRLYAEDPIGSMMTNIEGTKNILDFSHKKNVARVLFLSSVEIYGNALNETDLFDEKYCGYLDCNTLRAAYPEGKRAGEALCQAYREQYNMDIVIPRLSRVYGPTMRLDDSKALSQFILNTINGEDIVLKSEGKQRFSYVYVMDAVRALLLLLVSGKEGEAYNIADTHGTLQLKEIAEILANISKRNVTFELPDEVEKKGFSKAQIAVMDTRKIQELGWQAGCDMENGLKKTIKIMCGK